jgi:WD40 repeat protein
MGADVVLSGSDDGFMLVHCERTGRLLARLRGDDDIVNCVQSAPGGARGGLVACSGIDNTIKVFTCSAQVDPSNIALHGSSLDTVVNQSYDATCRFMRRHDFLGFDASAGEVEEQADCGVT